jgi:hypothetical protein
MDLLPGVDSDDFLKPSLFELLAQEQLRYVLQPALKYVLSVSRAFIYPQLFLDKELIDVGVCPKKSTTYLEIGEQT